MPEAPENPEAEPVRVSPLGWVLLAPLLAVPAALVALYTTGFHDSQAQFTRSQVDQIREQLEMFRMKHGVFPEELEEMAKYFPNGKVPTDSWGRPYLYLHQPGGLDYFVVSLGADGVVGGDGEDEDIRSDRDWRGEPR